MKPRCILFDLDNTLVDRPASLTKYAEEFEKAFSGRLGDISIEKLDQIIQKNDGGGYIPKDRMFPNLATVLPWSSAPTTEELSEHWFSVYPAVTVGMPGHREILESVRSCGIKTGLLTNGRTKTQNTKVDLLGLRPLLDCIVISEATGYKKPAPEIFFIAMSEAGTQPEETWFVGDHPINDVKGANQVGLTGVWMTGSHPWPSDEPPPNYEIDALDQLSLLIDIAETT